MRPLVVVNKPERWPLAVPGVEVVSAVSYLTDAERFAKLRVRVFNLCRSYRYQSAGYYVSLLAEARGHRPMPSAATIQELKATEIVRLRSEDLDALIQRSLAPISSDRFELSSYFGRNVAKRHDRLAAKLFQMFDAPLMRATFRRVEGHWHIVGLRAISGHDVPDSHHDTVVAAMADYFRKRHARPARRRSARYDLAILVDREEEEGPSDVAALRKFARAAKRLDVATTFIDKGDYARLAEFDALFIRTTTSVNHYTYRFARRAHAEEMVVIDDPDSILRCTNKVYLAELLGRHHVPAPKTMVIHANNTDRIVDTLGLPCVLKEPDSCFSAGVFKVDTDAELREATTRLLESSDLIIGQEFTPTDFDWRIGVLDRTAIYACRYHMLGKHWQIAKQRAGTRYYGKTDAVPLSDVPAAVLDTALRAAGLIGDGLYGVDLKQHGEQVTVIEINDNPSIGIGAEDGVLGDALYERIMASFVHRLDRQRHGGEA